MNRRTFFKSGLAAATLASSVPLSANAFAQSVAHDVSVESLNPSGIRTAGIRMLPVVGGKYKVWTKRMGDASTKVLLLHGGPAFTHAYIEAMESFLPDAGLEMYYYDQLGCGNSDIPDDPTLWTLQRYCEEVEEVRRGLGLENFVLYGHSWGGILALEYALKYQHHLKGLVISNMTASCASYVKRTTMLRHTLLSRDKQTKLGELETEKKYDDPAYMEIMMNDLYPQMLCRVQPWPEPVTRAFRLANQKIYNEMQGMSEFEVTGNLKNWDRWGRLHEIRTRALTIGSVHDEMDPEDMKKMATLMPNATSYICPKGSHLCMWDDQANYFGALIPFLKSL